MEIHIAKFLERFKSIGLEDALLKEEIVKGIKESIKIEISPKEIEFKGADLIIQGNAFLKSEVYMKKEALMKRMENLLNNRKIETIR